MKLNAETLFTDRLLSPSLSSGGRRRDVSSYCHDEEVTRYLTWNPHPSLEDTEAFLAFEDQRANGAPSL
jgi:hypothetical protein